MHIEETSFVMMLDQLGHICRYCAMKKLEALDLKPGQAGILFILNCKGSLSQKKLADEMGITPPSMTVALKKLESRGFIHKETDESDQRSFRICLSGKGKECIEEVKDIAKDIEILLLKGISTEEKLLMRRLLLEMRRNITEQKEFGELDMHSVMKKTRKEELI